MEGHSDTESEEINDYDANNVSFFVSGTTCACRIVQLRVALPPNLLMTLINPPTRETRDASITNELPLISLYTNF
jgi:hypothetical protein